MTEGDDSAREISAARQRLFDFVAACNAGQWQAAPLEDDPRPACVIVDHVADAYEYIGGFIEDLVAGDSPEVNSALIDSLNATHAASVGLPDRVVVTEHLMRSGDGLVAMVAGFSDEQLGMGEGTVARLASIAATHADMHRQELEGAFGMREATEGD